MSSELLDNPSWHALTGPLARFAEGSGLARRFRPDVSIFAAIADDSAASWADLGALYGSGHDVLLTSRGGFNPPPGWMVLGGGSGFQMVLEGEPIDPDGATSTPLVRELTDDDVPAMVELVRLTEPGPFRERTIELAVTSASKRMAVCWPWPVSASPCRATSRSVLCAPTPTPDGAATRRQSPRRSPATFGRPAARRCCTWPSTT